MTRKTDDQIIMEYINKMTVKEQPKKDTRKKQRKETDEDKRLIETYQELIDDKVFCILGG